MITQSNAHQFKLFGFNFLIWRTRPKPKHIGIGGIVSNSCKLINYNNYIALAMPDGTPIPHQTELTVQSNIGEAATATVTLFVSID